jgi:uncharacterized membrane protein (UPF0127 family)
MIELRAAGSSRTMPTRRRTRLGVVASALALALVACAGSADRSVPASAVTPGTRLVTIDGDPWRVLAAGADGMRGRTDFGDADGMLFDMGAQMAPGSVAFVMDGVPIPLAIAWFAADGRLVGTDAMAPCAAEPCPRYVSPGPFRWAIEARPVAFDDLAADARLEVAP